MSEPRHREKAEMGLEAPKRRRAKVDITEAAERLLRATQPVRNSGWLQGMRPSQALLCCIGSGPWKIARRATIQQEALRILGDSDLIERRNELTDFFPLTWQKDLVLNIGRHFHLSAHCSFDSTSQKRASDVVAVLETALGCSLYEFPKVMCMYVRDYLELPIVPRDRHVNEKLKEFGLPLNTQAVTEAFIALVGAEKVNEYARGIFEEKSKNPTHSL